MMMTTTTNAKIERRGEKGGKSQDRIAIGASACQKMPTRDTCGQRRICRREEMRWDLERHNENDANEPERTTLLLAGIPPTTVS